MVTFGRPVRRRPLPPNAVLMALPTVMAPPKVMAPQKVFGSPSASIPPLFRRAVAAAGILIAGWLPAVADAQDRLQRDAGSTPITIADADAPALVVKIDALNELTADVNYLTAMVGRPDAGGMFSMMAGAMLQGVDPTRPIIVAVSLIDGRPMPMAVLPTSDVRSILRRLEAQVGAVEELEDGTMVIAVGVNTVYIRQFDGFAVLAQTADVLDKAPKDPSTLIAGMEEGMLTVRAKVQQVPQEMRQMLIDQIRQGFEQASAQAGNDGEQAMEAARTQLESLESVINETDEFGLRIDIDQQDAVVRFASKFTAVEGSELAGVYGGYQKADTKFGSVVRDDAAAYYHSSATVPPEAVEQLEKQMASSKMQIGAAMDQLKDQVGEQDAEAIRGLAETVMDQITATMKDGAFDIGMVVLADETQGRMALGTAVADGAEIARAVQEFAAGLEDKPDRPEFAFNTGTYNGVTLHEVRFQTKPGDDELRKIFGDTPTLHLGTADKYIYAAAGRDSMALMKELVDAPVGPAPNPDKLGVFKGRLLPMLEFARSIESSDQLVAMIDELLRAPDPGVITFQGEVIRNGTAGEFTISEGVLKALGAAAASAQPQRQGGF